MRAIELLSVPYDSGRRGWRMGAGPQALLRTGLVQTLRRAGRDVELVPIEAPEADPVKSAFDLCARIARVVHAASAGGRLPVLLAGNCMATVGALAGAADGDTGVLWLDAHGDLHTPETSTSGFLDGMAAATCLGWCHQTETARLDGFSPLPESRLVLAGARAIDPGEQDALQRSAVRTLEADVLRAGDAEAIRTALDGVGSWYIHLDLDVFDAGRVGRANEYAVGGGIDVAALRALIDAISPRRIVGLTLSAYDPAADPDGAVAAAAQAAITAVLDAA